MPQMPLATGGHAVPVLKLGTHQSKAYTGTAGVIDNATASTTEVVRVVCTTAAYIAFGTAPTATTSDIPVSANVPEYFFIVPGHKVSAVQQASGGTLHVTECV